MRQYIMEGMKEHFDDVYAWLIASKQGDVMVIREVTRQTVALVHYRTVNLGDNEYLKVVFNDGSFLLVLIKDRVLMFTEKLPHHIIEIRDNQIGVSKTLQYAGRDCTLVNKDDYQYVLRRYYGDFAALEGEVRFSDYEPEDGTMALLSLGWHSKDGSRADIFVEAIAQNEVTVPGKTHA